MHGVIINQFRLFVLSETGREQWERIADQAGISPEPADISRIYPDEVFACLLESAGTVMDRPRQELLERYGRYLAPALLRIYGTLLPENWGVLDVLERLEDSIHSAVRLRNPSAAPPALVAHRISPSEVVINYHSPRRLCALGEGIIRGLATGTGESLTIDQPECMHRGDERCLLVVRRQYPVSRIQ